MFETLKTYLIEELRVSAEEITMDSKLVEDLGLNSLEQADLALFCEGTFNVTVDDDDLNKFVTLGDVVRFMEAAQQ